MKDLLNLGKGKDKLFSLPYYLMLAWTAETLLSIALGGFVHIDWYWGAALALKLVVIFFNLFFIKRFFVDGQTQSYAAFRKYVGYMAIVVYCIYNFSHISWEIDGLIGFGWSMYYWVVAAISALLPTAVFLLLYPKKARVFWGNITPEEAANKKLLQENRKARKRAIPIIVLENVDFFVQTIFMVLLIQHFIFQLYVIPSESMVPTMLINDRPLVTKMLDAPVIPLSPLRMPRLSPIDRGSIVVFENPQYDQPLLHQIAQQCLFFMTFSIVDLDKDLIETPHYIVKRLVGTPGDSLMMVDDALYRKGPNDKEFVADPLDASYRCTNVYALSEELQKGIKMDSWSYTDGAYPTPRLRAILDKIEALKKSYTNDELERLLNDSLRSFDAIVAEGEARGVFSMATRESDSGFDPGELQHFLGISSQSIFEADTTVNLDRIAKQEIAYSQAKRISFRNFLMSGRGAKADDNLYVSEGRKFNYLWKLFSADVVIGDLTAVVNEKGSRLKYKPVLADYRIGDFAVYLSFYKLRNFKPFTLDSGYYFLMGDNRYNSFDFRYNRENRYEQFTEYLVDGDPYSVNFVSDFARPMKGLDESHIIGRVIFRLFPFNRVGQVK